MPMTNPSEFIPLTPLIVKLGAMLVAAIMVERFLTILNELMNRFVLILTASKYDAGKMLNAKLKTVEKAAAEAIVLSAGPDSISDPDPAEIVANPLKKSEVVNSRFDVKKIKPPDEIEDENARFEAVNAQNGIRKEFWMQLLGTLIAIGACIYTKFSVWGFITNAQTGIPLDKIIPEYWEYFFTGIIIGSGSKPVNFMMNFLINRKIEIVKGEVKADAEAEEKKSPEVKTATLALQPAIAALQPSIMNSIEKIIGFKYDGGDRPERLEFTHLYQAPVDMIVYHHTTLHSDAPFSEVVKEFDRKQWLTGYHSIVFKDGSIRVLCRWDRFGNHAQGYNAHSMGIAFQGSFETDARVPCSNYDGSLGLLAPTTEQVDSGARVVALWCHMHNMLPAFPEKTDAEFPKGIIPHKLIAAKACPGNNFPYELFKQYIKQYYHAWAADPQFKPALEAFKLIPRVMPNHKN
jgi:hypothetical protein